MSEDEKSDELSPESKKLLEQGIEDAKQGKIIEVNLENEGTPEQNRSSQEFKDRLSPSGEIANPIPPEEILAQLNAAKKNRWLAIFIQLSRCERFLKFIERNYVIRDKIDHENQTIETQVFENPAAVGPELTTVQIAKIYSLLKMYNTRHPKVVLTEILKTLGQEKSSPTIIPSATNKDVKEAVGDAEILKKKLD